MAGRKRIEEDPISNRPFWASFISPLAADGSFCNRTVFGQDWGQENVSSVARARKNLKLCRRGSGQGPCFYGKSKFTPEMVRQRERLAPWQETVLFQGGSYRQVRYKEDTEKYWQGGRSRPARA
jgi:hypothetical protein